MESKWYKILQFIFAAVCSAATCSVAAYIAVACDAAACNAGACCVAVRGVAACIAVACRAAACNAGAWCAAVRGVAACSVTACIAAACYATDWGTAAWGAPSCGITSHWTPCMHSHTQPWHTAHWPVWGCDAVSDSTMLQASTVERMDILTKMFTYELIIFILIKKYEIFLHILVRNKSTITLLEGKLLNMTESIFYMQFNMTWPNMAKVAQLMVKMFCNVKWVVKQSALAPALSKIAAALHRWPPSDVGIGDNAAKVIPY